MKKILKTVFLIFIATYLFGETTPKYIYCFCTYKPAFEEEKNKIGAAGFMNKPFYLGQSEYNNTSMDIYKREVEENWTSYINTTYPQVVRRSYLPKTNLVCVAEKNKTTAKTEIDKKYYKKRESIIQGEYNKGIIMIEDKYFSVIPVDYIDKTNNTPTENYSNSNSRSYNSQSNTKQEPPREREVKAIEREPVREKVIERQKPSNSYSRGVLSNAAPVIKYPTDPEILKSSRNQENLGKLGINETIDYIVNIHNEYCDFKDFVILLGGGEWVNYKRREKIIKFEGLVMTLEVVLQSNKRVVTNRIKTMEITHTHFTTKIDFSEVIYSHYKNRETDKHEYEEGPYTNYLVCKNDYECFRRDIIDSDYSNPTLKTSKYSFGHTDKKNIERFSNAVKHLLKIVKDANIEKNDPFASNTFHGTKSSANSNTGKSYSYNKLIPKKELEKWQSQGDNKETLTRDAENGNSGAQRRLGRVYDIVYSDDEKAVYWYKKAANQGDVIAQYNLGYAYDNGEGVSKSEQQAVYWYKKAANQGDIDAQNNLGYAYQNGEGVSQNYEKARYWYEKAANQGHVAAQFGLGIIYRLGEGVSQNYEKAKYWYEKAANQGHKDAQYSLGVRYAKGQGVSKNMQKARYWYEKACDGGNETACNKL